MAISALIPAAMPLLAHCCFGTTPVPGTIAGGDLLREWSFDPLELGPLLIMAALYIVRGRHMRAAGHPISLRKYVMFFSGVTTIAFALASPIDVIGEERLFSVHMVQHLLLGDIAPLLLAVGLDGRILRPLLALPVLGRIRIFSHPVPALIFWGINFYAWHLPLLYDAALRNSLIHACEHGMFIAGGLCLWGTMFEILPGPAWFGALPKVGFCIIARMWEMILANIFIWSRTSFYPVYKNDPRLWGIGVIHDQSLAGLAMLVEGSLITLAMIALFMSRWADQTNQQQALIEAGVPKLRAKRAARYGRATALLTEIATAAHATPAAVEMRSAGAGFRRPETASAGGADDVPPITTTTSPPHAVR